MSFPRRVEVGHGFDKGVILVGLVDDLLVLVDGHVRRIQTALRLQIFVLLLRGQSNFHSLAVVHQVGQLNELLD